MFFPPKRLFLSSQRLFLPQIYKIGTLILQSLIYNSKSSKFLPIISGNVLSQFKKLQTLFLLNPKTRIPNFFYGIGAGHG